MGWSRNVDSFFTKQRLADAFRDSVAGDLSAIRCRCGAVHRIVASQRVLAEELGRIGQKVVLNPAKIVASVVAGQGVGGRVM